MSRENTIIAAFRSSTDAQAAAADLQSAGVSRDRIDIESNASAKSTRSKSTSTEGGITGWFKSMFEEEDDPDRLGYENALAQGNCLLRVDVDDDEIPAVEDILNRHSPVDVYSGQEEERQATAGANKANAIPVIKEELQVGKRRVLRGGVRVYSRVVEEPIEEKVSLREESVRVERRPVDRAATSADLSGREDQVIEVQEFAEEPVIAKQARVVEEVRVGKDVSERTETVRDTLRHTEVKVEQTGERSGQTSGESFDDADFRSDFQKRYASSGATYDTYLPAYRYGYDIASEPRYKGRSFEDVESDLRSDYGRRYPNSTWERMKDAVRYGWNKVTGKSKGTAR